ncbi:MAG: DUF3106 domain-containing protein [Candidatus Accumulibacter sp.]|uniref:DUF3106 domain-containing protein n=1 Tax=Accumulibacter sp. TaxID=2053492 RepID=UPI001A5D09EE|nr:DUF3106 domain-containing protein [Accumulibacter sp.]MBL8391175.1 DUF3106 domain-containing protein [Accumulibacter sp.]HRD88875.1 DUF3106 domain-containing protein [Accumulibacter sp.]
MAEKLGVAVAVLTALLALPVRAEVPGPSAIVTPAQPQWTELTVEQKIVLAPLSDDWDILESNRQKKWLGIARRFASMTPAEQRRIQTQMQEWGKLTPAQRAQARENFITASQLPAEKKEELRQKWEEYSSLPEAEKERLKQQAASKPVPKPGHSPRGPLPAGGQNPDQTGPAAARTAKAGADGVAAVPSPASGSAAVSAAETAPAGGVGEPGR